jgi:glutamate-1-semialdehyde 2,1-aminomutase
MVAPFNDLDALETILRKHSDKMAAIIMEPMPGTCGMICPKPGYLEGVRELADRYGVLLIFDEVLTFRLSFGGMQAMSGVVPDLTALGKIIGGGFPVGAFGGKEETMKQFDPTKPEPVSHSGTFCANPITMTAGLVAMELYDQSAIDRVNGLGDRLRKGFSEALKRVGIKGQATGIGSMATVHWTDRVIGNARDAFMGVKSALELPKLFHLEMINRGIFSVSRNAFIISTPMTERDIDKALEAFEATLEVLKPYAAEAAPHLLER